MKKYSCVICTFLSFVIIFLSCINCFAIDIDAADLSSDEQQLLSEATLDDNFTDDKVLVILKNKNSLEFNDYGLEDFSDIGCKSVKVAFSVKRQHYKELIDQAVVAATKGLSVEVEDDIDLSTHNTIITLELDNPGKQNVLNAIKKLESREDVLFVGPNMVLTLENTSESTATYTDPDDIQTLIGLTQLSAVNYPNFVTVGVIDSGIYRQHSGLTGWSENQIDLTLSRDFTGEENTSLPIDPRGHGTHVAGIIGAQTHQSLGEIGVFPEVFLASLRVFNSDGYATIDAVKNAVEWADLNGIKIVNFSGGHAAVYYEVDNYVPLKETIGEYDGLFVCSAGNDDSDNNRNNQYPANFDLPNLIAVGASTANDTKSSFSNYGSESVDLFAPGVNILSCFPTDKCNSNGCENVNGFANTHVCNGYHSLSGTSMAAPFVTGVAAMLLAINDELSPAQLKEIILDNVDEVDALQGKCVTGGRLNAYKAVMAVLADCEHDFDYTHSTSGHISTCSICNYTETSRNALYILSQTSSSITVKCSVCSTQLPACSHTLQYSSTNDTYHRASCSTCNFAFNDEHTYSNYTNISTSGGHTADCDNCEYTYTEGHAFYEISWDEAEIEVGCRKCSIYISCTDQPDDETNEYTHGESCDYCGYVIAEEHTFEVQSTNHPNKHTLTCTFCGYSKYQAHNIEYPPVTDADYHIARCSICGYSNMQSHTWVTVGTITKCSVCGAIDTSNVPILSLPPEDEELTE